MAEAKLKLVIDAQDNASKTLSGIGSVMGTIGKTVAIGMAAAGTATVAFGISSVKAFADAQAAQNRFETYLKRVTKATDEQIEALRRQQQALSDTTRFDDDAIASAQGFLASFQANSKQIETLTPQLLDMAEGLRDVNGQTIGLEQASNMLGKALQLGTVGMLAKAGVTIPGTTKAMQELFQKQFESANMQERLNMLGTLLKGNFEGQAQAAGETLAGKMDILNHKWDNFRENVGSLLFTYLDPLLTKLNDLATYLQNLNVAETVAQAFGAIQSTIASLTSETSVFYQFIVTVFGPMWTNLRDTFIESWAAIVAAIQPIKPELEMIGKFFAVVIGGAVIVMVAAIAQGFKMAAQVLAGFVEAFSGAIQFIRGIVDIFVGVFTGDFEFAASGAKKALNGLWTFIQGIARIMFSPLSSSFDKVKEAIASGVDFMIGKLKSFLDWIKKAIDKINVFNDKKDDAGDSGKRATGGTVMTGKRYLVGENGPEYFVPTQSGRIEKTTSAPSAGNTVNININLSGAIVGDKASLIREIEQAISRSNEVARLGIA